MRRELTCTRHLFFRVASVVMALGRMPTLHPEEDSTVVAACCSVLPLTETLGHWSSSSVMATSLATMVSVSPYTSASVLMIS